MRGTEIRATYRVVTPMFLAGADQNNAELRLPSIKGALRFWWRALAYSRLGGDLEKIATEEALIFGSTKGQGAVMMRLESSRVSIGTQMKWRQGEWQSYVGYGLVERTPNQEAKFIEPGSLFTVCFRSRSEKHLEQLLLPIKALGLLGGLGGRSRKGWGSLKLFVLQDQSGSIWQEPKTSEEFGNCCQSLFFPDANPRIETASDLKYTAFCANTNIEINDKMFSSWQQAFKAAALAYKSTISSKRHSEKRVREGFGLPRQIKLRNYPNANLRRASCVFLSIYEFPSGQFSPVVTLLPAQFLPNQIEPYGGFDLINDFPDQLFGKEVD